MSVAICMNCGVSKRAPGQRCPRCHFMPQTDEDFARATVLSTFFAADELRRSVEDLKSIGRSIEHGQPYTFSGEEVDEALRMNEEGKSVTARDLIVSGVRWLGPPVLILLAAAWLLGWFK